MNKKIVGISSCAAGVAHTYMAKEQLVKFASKLGYQIKIETRGSMTENELTPKDIAEADMVIIAADVEINLDPFAGKKVWYVDTNAAISNPEKVINDAFALAQFHQGEGKKIKGIQFGGIKKIGVKKHIMTAIGYMLPITVAGGLLLAIPNAISINEDGGRTWPNEFTLALYNFGLIALRFVGVIFSLFLAQAIGGKPALAGGFIGGVFITDSALMSQFSPIPLPPGIGESAANAGFLGGMAIGFFAGFLSLGLQKFNWPKKYSAIIGILLLPLLVGLGTFIMTVYIIGGPITWLIGQFFFTLNLLQNTAPWTDVFVGMLFAALMVIDFGGPINKTAILVGNAIFIDSIVQGELDFVVRSAIGMGIPVPSLGMWFAVMLFPHKYSDQDRAAGQASLAMGMVGLTEGALPFAFKNPLKTIGSCVVGAMVGGALVTIADIHMYGGLGGPFNAWIGIADNSGFGFYWFFILMLASIITGLIFGFVTKPNPEALAEYRANKTLKVEEYGKMGLITPVQVIGYNFKKWAINFKNNLIFAVQPKNWLKKE